MRACIIAWLSTRQSQHQNATCISGELCFFVCFSRIACHRATPMSLGRAPHSACDTRAARFRRVCSPDSKTRRWLRPALQCLPNRPRPSVPTRICSNVGALRLATGPCCGERTLRRKNASCNSPCMQGDDRHPATRHMTTGIADRTPSSECCTSAASLRRERGQSASNPLPSQRTSTSAP